MVGLESQGSIYPHLDSLGVHVGIYTSPIEPLETGKNTGKNNGRLGIPGFLHIFWRGDSFQRRRSKNWLMQETLIKQVGMGAEIGGWGSGMVQWLFLVPLKGGR